MGSDRVSVHALHTHPVTFEIGAFQPSKRISLVIGIGFKKNRKKCLKIVQLIKFVLAVKFYTAKQRLSRLPMEFR